MLESRCRGAAAKARIEINASLTTKKPSKTQFL